MRAAPRIPKFNTCDYKHHQQGSNGKSNWCLLFSEWNFIWWKSRKRVLVSTGKICAISFPWCVYQLTLFSCSLVIYSYVLLFVCLIVCLSFCFYPCFVNICIVFMDCLCLWFTCHLPLQSLTLLWKNTTWLVFSKFCFHFCWKLCVFCSRQVPCQNKIIIQLPFRNHFTFPNINIYWKWMLRRSCLWVHNLIWVYEMWGICKRTGARRGKRLCISTKGDAISLGNWDWMINWFYSGIYIVLFNYIEFSSNNDSCKSLGRPFRHNLTARLVPASWDRQAAGAPTSR